jgi:quercetin dioxygenase-like cupin family protein
MLEGHSGATQMIHSNPFRMLLLAMLLMSMVLAIQSSRAEPLSIRRVELQRQDLVVPGREAIQVRVELDPGAAFGRHTHPGDEIIYVIAGTFEYEVEGRPAIKLSTGDVLFIPSGVIHAARNVGGEIAVELATYVVEIGKPLVVMVD